jgi:hypothetical protein
MLAIAATNFGTVLVFLAVYAATAAGKLPEAAFPPLLVLIFLAATVLWVRVEEARGAGLSPAGRAIRSVAALALSAILSPVLVLMPLFWLFHALPASYRLDVVLNRTMFLLAIAMVLTAFVNVAGGVVAVWRLLRARSRRPASPPEAAL